MINWLKNIAKGILSSEISTYEKEIKTLKEDIEILTSQVPNLNPKEEYYNTKYPYTNITYKRTDKLGTINIDVRQFLNKNNYLFKIFEGNEDTKTLECLKWVIENIKYTPDKTKYGLDEYWAFGYETLNSKKGDCEDGAILLYDLLRYNKIPSWKIRVSAGYVINPVTKIKEGHAYVTYYCEQEENWAILDWCYLPNK